LGGVATARIAAGMAARFTIDTLVEMLSRVGKPVRLAIG
jgi:predicted XRE-type DNA-binding protein